MTASSRQEDVPRPSSDYGSDRSTTIAEGAGADGTASAGASVDVDADIIASANGEVYESGVRSHAFPRAAVGAEPTSKHRSDVREEAICPGNGPVTMSGTGLRTTLAPVASIAPPAAVPVARDQRRGLLARLTVVSEVDEPTRYSRATKWLITFVVALASMTAPFGSAIFFPSLSEVAASLHTTETIANLSVAMYMLSISIFPLWWSAFSERWGRRSVYMVSFVIFTVFSVLSAVSTTISMLIVMRMLSGGAAASVLAIGAGTIADIWEVRERGRAMGIFYLGPLCGPLLAPIIGGALAEAWGWRSTQWMQAIFGGVVILTITFVLPETLVRRDSVTTGGHGDGGAGTVGCEAETKADDTIAGSDGGNEPQLAQTRSRAASAAAAEAVKASTSWAVSAFEFLFEPLTVIGYLRFAPVLLTVLWASITYGCLYVLNVSIEFTFARSPYSFSEILIGLLYIPNSIGYVLTSIWGGRWMDHIMAREARKAGRYDEKGRLVYRPEDRMRENAWIGALVVPAAFVWYGWAAQERVFWFAVIIANFFFGVGSMIVFSMATTMLTEFMPKRSSAGVALNNFVRNILSCVGTIVGVPLINAMGNGWLFTMLALVTLITGLAIIVTMKTFGPAWRAKMDQAFL